eukprot:g4.t1
MESTASKKKRVIAQAPVFVPTEEEFANPLEFIRKVKEQAEPYGIIKIITPESKGDNYSMSTYKEYADNLERKWRLEITSNLDQSFQNKSSSAEEEAQQWSKEIQEYGIPSSSALAFEGYVSSSCSTRSMKTSLLQDMTRMISPFEFPENISLYTTVQKPGDLIVTFPEAFHGGYNEGWNLAEAVNFGLLNWLPFGMRSINRYQKLKDPIFSMDKLLWTLVQQALEDTKEGGKTIQPDLKNAFIEACNVELKSRECVMNKLYRVKRVIPHSKYIGEPIICRSCKCFNFFAFVFCRCMIEDEQVLCLNCCLENIAFACGCRALLCTEISDDEIKTMIEKAYHHFEFLNNDTIVILLSKMPRSRSPEMKRRRSVGADSDSDRRNKRDRRIRHKEDRRESRRRRISSESASDRSKTPQSEIDPVNIDDKPTNKRKEPLSLEEVLKKTKEAQEAAKRPIFLTKQQRQEAALKRREEEVFKPKPSYPSRPVIHERSRRRYEDKTNEPERHHVQSQREKEKELELIKQQYLGQEKVKKRVLKPSEKFRFNFDWDVGDDTSRDLNPLYNNPHEAAPLFGRGMRAGMDRREQKKEATSRELALLQSSRNAAGLETKDSKKLNKEREMEADIYNMVDMKNQIHWSDKPREMMSDRDWRIFKEDFSISFKGSGSTPILPIRNWEEAELSKDLEKGIKRVGFKKPSPIQMAAIPIGMQGRDLIGIAETGSGKTAAFVIPLLHYIMRQPPMTDLNEGDGPYAVILAPTRELAQQIEEETVRLGHYTNYRVCSVVGGQSIEDQGFKLRRGCEIVIATPGRLIDCLERRYAVLNQCNYVVLDEADRMIDMGFEPQVIGVLDAMPSSNLKPENEDVDGSALVYRTTHMFSATMPTAVERLAKKYLRRPIVVTIGTAGRATENVSQRVLIMKENEKELRLEQEMEALNEKRAIVFVNTKNKCDVVYRRLEGMGFSCTVLHGGKTQDQRESSIKGFRDDTFNILIATDVAGRGIDVADVALVINYDMPNNIEMYTHRIGRTGRAGRKGVAISFLTLVEAEHQILYDLKKVLEDGHALVPPELARHPKAAVKPGTIEQRPKRSEILFAS